MIETNEARNQPLLKTDVMGRLRTPKERREKLLDEFEQSGLSGGEFATVVGIKYQTFATWVQDRKRARKQIALAGANSDSTRKVNWLEAVVDKAASSNGGLMIRLPCRARVEISDAGQVGLAAALLRALEGPQRGPC